MASQLVVITENLENKPFGFTSPFAKWGNYWIGWSVKAGLIFVQSLYDLWQKFDPHVYHTSYLRGKPLGISVREFLN